MPASELGRVERSTCSYGGEVAIPGASSSDRHLDRYRQFWSSVDPAGLVITDDHAELTVAGCAIFHAEEAAAAVARLDAGQFHDGRYWQAIDAAAALDAGLRDDDATWEAAATDGDFYVIQGCSRRTAAVAAATGLPEALLRQWVRGRSVERDSTGWFASRVAAAAEARSEVRGLLDRAESLDVDLSPLRRVDPLPAVMAMVADAAAALGQEVARGDQLGAAGAIEALIGVAEQLGTSGPDAETWVGEAYRAGGQEACR